ncbi:hypothetical protein ACFL4N_00370 [Thermodesulfobacteriota bacterium]
MDLTAKKITKSLYKRMKSFNDMGLYFFTHGKKIKRLKNGAPKDYCFIIGNGPSLSEMDLTRLKNEYTFCLNSFFLHKDINIINPKCYITGNPLFLKSTFFDKEAIPFLSKNPGMIKIFDYHFSRAAKGKMDELENVFFIRFNQNRRILSVGKIIFDPSKILPASDASVLIQSAIPLAVYMGFKKIFLVGCDCNYKMGKDFGKIDVNHFYKESDHQDMLDIVKEAKEKYGSYWKNNSHSDFIMEEWTIVKRCVENQGVEIINAGIGGALNVFRRIPYENVI